MCGILATFNPKKINQDLFKNQLDTLRHRGPSASGTWFNEDNTVALGSRRLSIQDLSNNGNMPMKIENYVITYNGELYNFISLKKDLIRKGYNFNSNSDTEVILNAYIHYGKNCLNYFEGMFAFVIYDLKKQTLFACRDIAGEKPFFYSSLNNSISFSSEFKPFFEDKDFQRKLNKEALNEYLANGYVNGKNTIVSGINKLEPGHYLEYSILSNTTTIEKYWSIPKFTQTDKSEEELIEELDQLLNNSVKKQLVSDVPIGVLLSGGVDSSLISYYAAKLSNNPINTFHISFNGSEKYNESEYAKKASEFLNTDHHELDGNCIEYDLIDEIFNFLDEPIGDSSIIPTYLVSKLTKNYVTVALGGDGGDELFGGYGKYQSFFKEKKTIEHVPNPIRKLGSSISEYLPIGLKGKNYLYSISGDQYQRFLKNKIFDTHSINKILTLKSNLNQNKEGMYFEKNTSNDVIYDFTKYDFENYLINDILVKVDRASMACSLETRAPFLDKQIIEFAFGTVPSNYKVDGENTKKILKKLIATKFPKEIDFDRKQGFSIPLNDWISTKWYDFFKEEINEFPEILNKKEALRMCENVKKGYQNSTRLFTLVMMSKWIKKYKIIY